MTKIFKKIFAAVFLSLFILLSFSGAASAQDQLLFGQSHYYTVVFRGNGEAITYVKLAITNPDETPMTSFSFELPKVSPTEMTIYQMKLPKECAQYDYSTANRPCLQYRDPDYKQSYYYYNTPGAEYQKIKFAKSGDLYQFTLPTPIEPYKSTAIIIAYAAKGYARESLGLFKYDFETIKVPSRISEVQVAVDVDSELFIKGKRSDVNYQTVGNLGEAAFGMSAGMSSADLDKVVTTIGMSGQIHKSAKNLSPDETFTVKGEYARSWFRLYLRSIVSAILIIAAIFAAIYFITKFLKKKKGEVAQKTEELAAKPASPFSGFFDLNNAGLGFLSVAFTIGLIYLIKYIFKSDAIHSLDDTFAVIGFIMVALLFLLIIFGPAIFMATKKGWKSFLSILILEFSWFLLIFILYIIFFNAIAA